LENQIIKEYKSQTKCVRHVLSFYLQKTKEKEGTEIKRYLDFLDNLLSAREEHGVGLTPLEIRNEADTFLFEGLFS
jgi:hypothetical protein